MQVFPKIALSLSGGGYRAASFHLGSLEMLNNLKLLESVKILSTVSGGTITGAAYALSICKSPDFNNFSANFQEYLKSTNVIAQALENLPDSVDINQSKQMPSLIRAAASIYASEKLFGNKTLGDISENCSGLEDISFNATDFRTGNSFRFQKSNNQQVYSGNRFSQISGEINKQIRLADIVAASSCFPSGFEPIRFPADFVWTDISLKEAKESLGKNFSAEIPLMDGGVFDNQGIDSVINIKERKNQQLDLIIVSDTDQRNAALLEYPTVENAGILKVKYINWLLTLLQIASIISIIAVIFEFVGSLQTNYFSPVKAIFLYLIPLLFAGTVVLGIFYLRYKLSLLREKFKQESGIDVWKYLKNLTIPQLIEFPESRIKSLITMSSSVFMKRVRDLSYSRVYADTDIRNKIISNQIYDLNKNIHFKQGWGKFISEVELTPTERLKNMALTAEGYKTNLWFLNAEDLENLIYSGKATMCYNIIDYLLEHRSEKLSDTGSGEFDLFARAKQEWLKFNEKTK